ncbi:hypothetical protein T4B_13877, partial [Trichinella pseudospiralis]
MSLVALYPFSRDGRIRHTSSYRTQEILLAFFSKVHECTNQQINE